MGQQLHYYAIDVEDLKQNKNRWRKTMSSINANVNKMSFMIYVILATL